MRVQTFVAALFAVSLVFASANAHADPKPAGGAAAAAAADAEKKAADLKADGDRLLSDKKFVEALDAYDKSFALVPNPALHFNRGRALQFLARYPEALAYLERFMKEASDDLKSKVPGLADLVKEVSGKVATLDLTANVSGGRILVGGKDVGQTPMSSPLRVNAGKTVIEVIADGYFPFKKEVDLGGNATTKLDAQLASRDSFGFLVVKSTIASSSVSIDGKSIGLVPAEAALSAGTHPVVVSHEGYDDAATQVVLKAGERKELLLDPVKGTPVTGKWWFWTIIGVVAIGGATAATVIALTTERAAPTGDFSPGKVGF